MIWLAALYAVIGFGLMIYCFREAKGWQDYGLCLTVPVFWPVWVVIAIGLEIQYRREKKNQDIARRYRVLFSMLCELNLMTFNTMFDALGKLR